MITINYILSSVLLHEPSEKSMKCQALFGSMKEKG